MRILNDYIYDSENFVMIDKGRTSDERSVIIIENGKYIGHGYIDESTSANSMETFKSIIEIADYYPDNDDIVKSWLKKNKVKVLSFSPAFT